MKYIFIIFFSVLSSLSFGQDIEFMHYLNVYRKHHEKKTFTWSHSLGKIASDQNFKNELQDSLSHSHLSSEIATMGTCLPACKSTKDDFIAFLKSEFGLEYKEPKTNNEVARLVKIYAIYMFDKSPKHKAILLGNYKYIGFDLVIRDITYKPTTIPIGAPIIGIPLAAPILAVVSLLSFIGTFNEFILARLFLIDMNSRTIAVGLQGFIGGQYAENWGAFAAGSIIASVPIVIIFLSLQKYIISGLTAGSVKG
jgi:hypothetical protein